MYICFVIFMLIAWLNALDVSTLKLQGAIKGVSKYGGICLANIVRIIPLKL